MDLPRAEDVYPQLKKNDFAPGFERLQDTSVKISEELVVRIARLIKQNGATGVTSIGCGYGVFEWFLSFYFPPLAVHGVDVICPDDLWPPAKWRIMYGTTVSDEPPVVVSASQALLFSWGVRSPWEKYLQQWRGNVLIVIGDKTCTPAPAGDGKKDHEKVLELGFTLKDKFAMPDASQVVCLYLRN